MPESHRSTRRDFLRGKAAADVLANLPVSAGNAAEGNSLSPAAGMGSAGPEAAAYLTTISRPAMACDFAVLLNAGQYPCGVESALAALDLVEELEAQLSVFRDSSEVSRLNRAAFAEAVEVESQLFALLKQAAEIHRATAGAYDIATGALTKLWGFYQRQGRMPDTAELTATMQRVGLRHVQFDDEKQTVRFLTPGVEINLGSIGKGYALDRVAELLQGAGIEHFLLHGGNSSVLGRGSKQGSGFRVQGSEEREQGAGRRAQETEIGNSDGPSQGWWIGLRHPLEPERRIGEVLLCNRALGTSGSGTQFFVHEGRRFGHILDPRTGCPAEGSLSATVAAATGAQADALATAFYVLGPEGALDYCRRHPGISAVMMSPATERPDGKSPTDESGRVDVMLWGWADDEIRMHADDSLSIRQASP
jgi:FAD:protein FMN transferase